MDRFTTYSLAVTKALSVNKNMRLGQVLFNVLDELEPEVANEVRGTALDPFYVGTSESAVYDSFWVFVEKQLRDDK